jgi:hypothetical protein
LDEENVLKIFKEAIKDKIEEKKDAFMNGKVIDARAIIDVGEYYLKLGCYLPMTLNKLSFQACKECDVIKIRFHTIPKGRPYEEAVITFRKKKPPLIKTENHKDA